MEEIIFILKNDLILKELVGNRIVPFGAAGVVECITYVVTPISNNKLKSVDKYDITAIAFSKAKSEQIMDRVKSLILTEGDDALTNTITDVSLNGGGNFDNTVGIQKTYHFKAYFNVTRIV